jgi:hypothetical protein
MELRKLEKYKKLYKTFGSAITSLQDFLNVAASQMYPKGGEPRITPYVVSQKIHIPETDAIFLLSLAEQEHIVRRIYQVFSDDNTFLDDFSNDNDIPDTIHNPNTGEDVNKEHFYVDLVFEFAK